MGVAEYQRQHKAAGLCIFCSEKAMDNSQFCLKHYYTHSLAMKKNYEKNRAERCAYRRQYYRKMVKEGRCVDCGIPLIEEDTGRRCVNCETTKLQHAR
jgi:hypothetical protein